MSAPSGFEWVREGRVQSLVRGDLRDALSPILHEIRAHGLPRGRPLAGGRGGTVVVRAADRDVVVRPYRRGGLPARLLRDTYLGCRARPFRELRVTEALRRRGAPVVEVYAASTQWLVPGCYRGWLMTRYMSGAQTLWEWASGSASAADRDAVLQRVGRAIRQLHDSGARHPDLNLNNILLCAAPGADQAPAVLLIDFDRAPLPRGGRGPAADLARLARSARKLDPLGARLTAANLATLQAAYWEGGACA